MESPPACRRSIRIPGCPLTFRRCLTRPSQSSRSAPLARSLEHSIENQLPFLQHILAATQSAFLITPICIGALDSLGQAQGLAAKLAAALTRRPAGSTLVVATTDLTHAGATYGEAPAAGWMSLREHCIYQDSPLLHSLCTLPSDLAATSSSGGSSHPVGPIGGGPGAASGGGRASTPTSSAAAGFLRACESTQASLCGKWPVAVFLSVAERQGWATELLAYAPSDLYVATGSINGFASFAAWGH